VIGRFADHFRAVAAAYAGFRPKYPPELFGWLAQLAPARELAWDCACGSGQASLDLAAHFTRVIGTDASPAQIAAAPAHPQIEFRVAPADASPLAHHSADLITVAQALHWFHLDRFYAEVRRVLKPRGVLAAWTYGIVALQGASDRPDTQPTWQDANSIVQMFYRNIIGPYWPPERRHVETGYRTLPFPFAEISAPAFAMQADWTLAEFAGYLRSWSATARFVETRGFDPVADLAAQLLPLWGNARGKITWPLSLRVARL
jgi:SAM-dependent methyltransferase